MAGPGPATPSSGTPAPPRSTPVASTSTTAAAAASTSRRGRRGALFLFLSPFFVLFAVVIVAPVAYAGWMSLFREQSSGLGFGGVERSFTGLANYSAVLADPAFRASFLHIAAYCLAYIPVMIGGALGLALLVDSAYARAKRFFQLAFFLPHAVPGLIAAIIWIYLYTPGLSPVIDWIDAAGGSWNFFSPGNSLSSMVNIAVWQWIGYNMVIFFAALQAVPREVIEAATVDGAGAWRTALGIKVPIIRSSVVMTVLFTCVGAVQLFTEPRLLSERAQALGNDWSPTMYIVSKAFIDQDYASAAAASLLLALVAGALSFLVTRIGKRWQES
ncbi:carbohydrate ABC transporter permease [Streptomyces xanthophaeus]|uniref:carbohydrate ABC transporter permease n=1 Tax=Streptomyces xanthophaeus TaxID=67385 RepID=UPI00398FC259